MQLFQEYVVGKVSRSPHMFSVTSGDITFLKQFPAEYWVDALWQRYNPVLFGALKKEKKKDSRNKNNDKLWEKDMVMKNIKKWEQKKLQKLEEEKIVRKWNVNE